ncbi:copia protein [Lasius niger]|uniref:Copia protein n=1 Tax=Lasius niger TaxID=67767 RepID=A0A0J7NFR8_LASNI|nr:copia protein [Lasius niger]
MYVPDVSTNLLSVNALTKDGAEVIFTQEVMVKCKNNITGYYADLLDDFDRLTGHAAPEVELECEIKLTPQNKPEAYLTENSKNKGILWHRKMGHLGYKNMKKLVKHTEGLKLNLNDLKEKEKLCEICQKAKQSRVNLMNQEQEQQDHCRLYTQISAIQLTQLLPHTPQLNRKAEKLNRTLMDRARTLIFDNGLNKEMWGEALYTATYLLNRSPTEALKNTLYEIEKEVEEVERPFEEEEWEDAEESEEQEEIVQEENEEDAEEEPAEEYQETPRRSKRQRKHPERYHDYVMLTYKDAVMGPNRSR